MRKEGGDEGYFFFIQKEGGFFFSFHEVDDADDHGGFTGPCIAFDGFIDGSSIGTDPSETCVSGVALSNGIGGNESQGAAGAEEIKATSEKMGHQITVSVTLGMQHSQPGQIAGRIAVDKCVFPCKGRVAYEGIEAGLGSLEYFGEFELPVEGHEAFGQIGEELFSFVGPSGTEVAEELFPFGGSTVTEEGLYDEVTHSAEGGECFSGILEEEAQLFFFGIVVGVVDGCSVGECHAELVDEEGLHVCHLFLFFPVEGTDLSVGEAEEGVSEFEGVVKKGEAVVPGQGCEP